MLFKNFLKTLPSFQFFSETDIDALSKAMYVREYPEGHTFIRQGQKGKELYLLVEGKVNVSRYDDLTGASDNLKTLLAGEIFGLLSLIDTLPAAASCTALEPVKVANLSRTTYNLLFQSAAPIAYHFQYLVAQQLARDLYDRNESLRKLLIES